MPTYYNGNGDVSPGRIFNLFPERRGIWASLHRLNGRKWCHMFWNLRRLPSRVLYLMEHVRLCEKCFLWSKVCSFGVLVPSTYLLWKNCHFCRKFPKSEMLCKWTVYSIVQNF